MSSTAPGSTLRSTTEQLQAADPSRSVWVMANAGSGKTHVLVNRVVRLLLAGNAPESILCLTYTKAAATEMSLRLFKLLASWVAHDDAWLTEELLQLGLHDVTRNDLARARRLFAISIETPGGLKIQTIHAFCEKLLQLFPAESGLAPGFSVMDDTERQLLLTEARDAALAEAAEEGGLSLLDDGSLSSDLFESLCRAFLSATSTFNKSLEVEPDAFDTVLRVVSNIHHLGSPNDILSLLLETDEETLERAISAFADVAPFGSAKFSVHAILKAIALSASASERLKALHAMAFTKEYDPRANFFSKDTKTRHALLCQWVDAWKIRIVELSEAHTLSLKIEATIRLLRLMQRVDRTFRALKRERGLYDFDDLIVETRKLLTGNGAAQWVLRKLDSGLSHVLVDEAQDTSPAQWEIIKALAEEFFAGEGIERPEKRSIFVVGDIKQSIYSFQGADTEAFARAREIFRTRVQASGKPLAEINLTVSYRSLPAVLEMVDTVFGENAPATQGLKQDERGGGHSANRKDEGEGIFEFWPLLEPDDAPEPDPWIAPVDRVSEDSPRVRLARSIAARIKSWIGRRLLPAHKRAVRPGDILILLQKRGALFDALLAALRDAKIPVAGADRLKLQDNLAVMDLMALAQFCLLPADDLSLACVLKSPLVPRPFSEDDLVTIAAKRTGCLWESLTASTLHPDTVDFLAEQLRIAPVTGPHAFLARVLNTARSAIAARLGDEALDATAMLLDAALAFEREYGTSLAAFLHWFMARDEDVKRELEGPAGEVRLMTVHGAKGLEGNIVILPDAADPPPGNKVSLLGVPYPESDIVLPFFDAPSRIKPAIIKNWKDVLADKSLDERKRLLYVAMTRARDELYIGGSLGRRQSDAPDESWYKLVQQGLDHPDARHKTREVKDDHFERPVRRFGDEPQWIAAEEAPHRSAAMTLPAWATAEVPATAGSARWESVTRVAARSSMIFDREAARKGTALHRVLELSKAGDTVEMLARRLARQRLDPGLAAALHAVLTAPETAGFFADGARSETAIAGLLDGVGQIQGRLDRLRITGEEIWLLDFKTGARGGPVHESHIRQMAQYAALLVQAFPRRKLRAALLWTQDMVTENLSETELSRVLESLRRERGSAPA